MNQGPWTLMPETIGPHLCRGVGMPDEDAWPVDVTTAGKEWRATDTEHNVEMTPNADYRFMNQGPRGEHDRRTEAITQSLKERRKLAQPPTLLDASGPALCSHAPSPHPRAFPPRSRSTP